MFSLKIPVPQSVCYGILGHHSTLRVYTKTLWYTYSPLLIVQYSSSEDFWSTQRGLLNGCLFSLENALELENNYLDS